jgi:hypothetical protein
MDEKPFSAPWLEAGPVASGANFLGWVKHVKIEIDSVAVFNQPRKSAVTRLIIAKIDVSAANPSPFLPVGYFPAPDNLGLGMGPQSGPKCPVKQPRSEFRYAHARTPTSALVEAKSFSPSFTLS